MFFKYMKRNCSFLLSSNFRTFRNDAFKSTGDGEMLIEKSNDLKGIYILNFNKKETRNALGSTLVQSLNDNLNKLKTMEDLRVLILSSKVKGIFCAGANLKERIKMQTDESENFVKLLRSIAYEIYQFPFPTIAAIDGVAVGGGLEMALACDIRIASDNAKLGLVETKLAILPGACGSQILPRIIGPAKAKELIFTAQILNGKEAEKIGLVNTCVLQNLNGCAALLNSIEVAQNILPNGPIAIKAVKQAINEGLNLPLIDALEIEKKAYQKVLVTQDRLEGIKAFIEKRNPVFKGE